jgi:putative endopeptidase
VRTNNALSETQARLILTDSHSLGMHSGNGLIVNMNSWYKAFKVKSKNKLYKEKNKRTRIW